MKSPKCPICGGPHYKYMCFQNPKRKYALKRKYSQYKAGKTPKHDKVLSAQSLNRKRLIIDLDSYCSKYVRLKAANNSGIAVCYTCGKQLPWKMMDCGHYRSRQHLQTRFDLNGLRTQCQVCNRTLRGNLKKYREHLVMEIGEDKVREIETRPPRKISTPELQEMLLEMKRKYALLLEERKKARYN